MPFYRAFYEGYIEGEHDNEELARGLFMEALEGVEPGELTIEVFNDETKKWE